MSKDVTGVRLDLDNTLHQKIDKWRAKLGRISKLAFIRQAIDQRIARLENGEEK